MNTIFDFHSVKSTLTTLTTTPTPSLAKTSLEILKHFKKKLKVELLYTLKIAESHLKWKVLSSSNSNQQ